MSNRSPHTARVETLVSLGGTVGVLAGVALAYGVVLRGGDASVASAAVLALPAFLVAGVVTFAGTYLVGATLVATVLE